MTEGHTPESPLDPPEAGGGSQITLADEAVRAKLKEMPLVTINSILVLLLEKMLPASDEAEGWTPIGWRTFLPDGSMLTVEPRGRPR